MGPCVGFSHFGALMVLLLSTSEPFLSSLGVLVLQYSTFLMNVLIPLDFLPLGTANAPLSLSFRRSTWSSALRTGPGPQCVLVCV